MSKSKRDKRSKQEMQEIVLKVISIRKSNPEITLAVLSTRFDMHRGQLSTLIKQHETQMEGAENGVEHIS